MTEFAIKIENKDGARWLRKLKKNLHKEETLRLEFFGLLTTEDEGSVIYISLANDLKLKDNSEIQLWDVYCEFSEINTLPNWEKLHPSKKLMSVRFEASVIRFEGDVVIVLLPDSYEEVFKEDPPVVIRLPEKYKNPIRDFVAIDFETIQAIATDGNKYPHLPISIGLVKVRGGEVMGKFYSPINPPTTSEWLGYIKPSIKPSQLTNAPCYNELFPIVDFFVGSFQPVAFSSGICKNVFKNVEKLYNVKHSFLHKKTKGAAKNADKFVDPLVMLQAFGEKENSLEKACKRRGIYTFGSHNALYDAEATAKLLLELEHEKLKYEIVTE